MNEIILKESNEIHDILSTEFSESEVDFIEDKIIRLIKVCIEEVI
jgi:hypothetical protein